MNKQIVLFLIAVLFLSACNNQQGTSEEGKKFPAVTADVETTPVSANRGDDAADDPAIWINEQNPAKSLIIGTDKKSGLAVYDLNGKQLHFYPVGRVNNVDVRYQFPLENDTVDIVAASNRSSNTIDIFSINPRSGKLKNITDTLIQSQLTEVYGFCLYKSPVDSTFYAFINSKDGQVEQWILLSKGSGIHAELVRRFDVGGQVEGMVADDEQAVLYVGEEEGGIWKYSAETGTTDKRTKILLSDTSNNAIEYDVEGLSLYYSDNGNGYLIASSQGNNSFAVFERQGDNKYLGSFIIKDGVLDGAQETDGLDVTHRSPGDKFPTGILVVQDGFNYDGQQKQPQNFKLVSWEKIADLFEEKLTKSPDYRIKSRHKK